MPVPFGFSVGDFIAVVNLLKDAAVALKDCGGASDQYQRTVCELESLSIVVKEFEAHAYRSGNLSLVNAIRSQAQNTQDSVSSFLNGLKKYDVSLGSGAPPSCRRGIGSKIRWGIQISKEVKALWQAVHAQSLSLRLLLGLHSVESLEALTNDGYETRAELSSASTQIAGAIQALGTDLKNAFQSIETAIQSRHAYGSNELDILNTSIAHIDRKIDFCLQPDVRKMSNDMQKLFKKISEKFQDGLAAYAHVGDRRVDELQGIVATSQQLNDLSNLIRRSPLFQLSGADETATEPLAHSKPSFQDTLLSVPQCLWAQTLPASRTLPTFDSPCPLISSNRKIIRHLSGPLVRALWAEIVDFLRITFKAILRRIQRIVSLYPQMIVVLALMWNLPARVSLLLTDNLNFEDVLGRTHNLNFQHFRHWRVFESCLQGIFEGRPGFVQVLNGKYRITHAGTRHFVLDASNWGRLVKPGMKIVMAVTYDSPDGNTEKCPRCSTRARHCSAEGYKCDKCKLMFSKSVTKDPRQARSEENLVEWSNSYSFLYHRKAAPRSPPSPLTANGPEVSFQALPSDPSKLKPRDDSTGDSTPMDHEVGDELSDGTDDLYAFRRVHILQPPRIKRDPSGIVSKLVSDVSEPLHSNKEPPQVVSDPFLSMLMPSQAKPESLPTHSDKFGFGYPLTRVWAHIQ